jgi:5,10-methylenetetrahydromethanopterin reductase
MALRLSVALPPGPKTVDYARLASELGYERLWLFDSAALYEDIWIWLARVADATDIDVGTAVLVPNLRHVMTTASAIATIERLAPGRLACGFGTGATARWLLNQRALTWSSTRRYLEQLRGLLRGEVITIDGERCQMVHHPEWAMARPIDTPLVLSAVGPKGTEIAEALFADDVISGYMGVGDAQVSIPWRIRMTAGTVLDDGESISDDRVRAALGPWYVVRYHAAWEFAPDAVTGLPGGAEWLASIEAERPSEEWHLVVHEGHVTNLMARDDSIMRAAGDALASTGWVGTRDEVRARAEASAAAGTTEIMYTPAGDIAREMRTFAEAVLGA